MFQYSKAAAATMWLLGAGGGRKDDSESSSSKHSFTSRGSRRNGRGTTLTGKKESAPSRRRPRKSKISNDEEGTSQTSVDKDCSVRMMTDETYSGIEVSLSNDADVRLDSYSLLSRAAESISSSKHCVIKLRDQLVPASRVHHATFSLVNSNGKICILPVSPTSMDTASNEPYQDQTLSGAEPPNFQHGKHRLPLFRKRSVEQTSSLLFDDILFLLRSHDIVDERTTVDDEIALLNEEISALESDRSTLEKMAEESKESGFLALSSTLKFDGPRHETSKTNTDWDCFHQLLVTTQSLMATKESNPQQTAFLTSAQRTELQCERGLNLSFQFPSNEAHEALLAKCGCKASLLRKTPIAGGTYNAHRINDEPVTALISPQNCRDGGAAATIQHVTLLKTSSSSSGAVTSLPSDDPSCSFFISRDTAKSFCHGGLPDRLVRRMQTEKRLTSLADSRRFSADNLLYLSVGPWGCYYATFRSGECWWGVAVNEIEHVKGSNDLDILCREWDVYRIAFGVGTVWNDGRAHPVPRHSNTGSNNKLHHKNSRRNSNSRSSASTPVISLSWVVIGRDGRVAWKNIPIRLHNLLSSRVASSSAPVEVALGHGDAYFVKFLDGTTDWQLPARIAVVCQQLEREGRAITSISLNPELPHAFVIRHR